MANASRIVGSRSSSHSPFAIRPDVDRSEHMTGQQTTASLEDRIRAIEDRLEIYNLIASHPPSADTGGRDHIAACWVEDGVFDRGENLSSPRGRDALAEPGDEPGASGGDRRRPCSLHRAAACRDRRRHRHRHVLSGDPGAADAGRSGRGAEPRQQPGLPRPSHDREPLGARAHGAGLEVQASQLAAARRLRGGTEDSARRARRGSS